MAAKRILLLPNTNTFSHLGQALAIDGVAIAGWLEADGWQCHIGCTRCRLAWAGRFCSRCHEINPALDTRGLAPVAKATDMLRSLDVSRLYLQRMGRVLCSFDAPAFICRLVRNIT